MYAHHRCFHPLYTLHTQLVLINFKYERMQRDEDGEDGEDEDEAMGHARHYSKFTMVPVRSERRGLLGYSRTPKTLAQVIADKDKKQRQLEAKAASKAAASSERKERLPGEPKDRQVKHVGSWAASGPAAPAGKGRPGLPRSSSMPM